jgi:hypothetical protein
MESVRQTSSWPRFSRRTLWIIIIVLIPVITILNSGGRSPVEQSDTKLRDHFDLTELEFVSQGPDWRVQLPGSGLIGIAVATPGIPTGKVDVPNHQDFDVTIRRNHTVTYIKIPAERASLDVTLDFLHQWLPPMDQHSHLIVAGEITDATGDYIREKLHDATGDYQSLTSAAPKELTAIPLPAMGSKEQFSVLLAANVLNNRLSGYATRFGWNHRGEVSYLTINATLRKDWLSPVTEPEFEQAKAGMLAAAAKPDRTVDQILRYLITIALDDLPATFIVEQSELIGGLTLEDGQSGMAYIADRR